MEILDQPDNTLLIHALLDDNKYFDATLKTYAATRAVVAEPILQAAYHRYPFLLKVSTNWLHNIFKRLQQKQRTEVIVEFNGETGALEFLSTMEGAPFREAAVIPSNHILQNPFLAPTPAPAAPAPADTHLVYTDTRSVAEAPKDRVPEAVQLVKDAAANTTALTSFLYRAQFAPRSIWMAVKRNKVGSFVHLYLAPKEPILFQYILQRSHTDSRRAACYDTWIRAVEKTANPHIRMPAGGSAAVARKMLEIAPNLGTNDLTMRVASQAIQELTGCSKIAAIDKHNMAIIKSTNTTTAAAIVGTSVTAGDAATGDAVSTTASAQKSNSTTEKTGVQTSVQQTFDHGYIEKPKMGAGLVKRKHKSRSPPQLDSEGNPIPKKRGRPPKNPPPPSFSTTKK